MLIASPSGSWKAERLTFHAPWQVAAATQKRRPASPGADEAPAGSLERTDGWDSRGDQERRPRAKGGRPRGGIRLSPPSIGKRESVARANACLLPAGRSGRSSNPRLAFAALVEHLMEPGGQQIRSRAATFLPP